MTDDWRDKLWHDFRHLFARDRPFRVGIATLPDGWRDLAETTLDRISAVVRADRLARVTIERLAHQRGEMSIEWSGPEMFFPHMLTDIVDHAAARAATTCQICGEAGRLFRMGDEVTVRCATHRVPASEEVVPAWPTIRIDRAITQGRAVIIRCRVYDRATDRFVDTTPDRLGIRDFE